MGSGHSSARKGMSPMLQELFRDAARISQAISCKDLVTYRDNVRPILEKLIGQQISSVHMEVDRGHIFKIAIGHYKSFRKSQHERLMITFTSDGCQEEAFDGSGVRREFYSLFFQACLVGECNMFEGEGRRKVPSNDMSFIDAQLFKALGTAIVSSILSGDCGFPYLAPAAYFYLLDQQYEEHLKQDDIPDPSVKHLVKQILEATTDEELTDVVTGTDGLVIDFIGWPTGRLITMKNRDCLVQQLIKWSTIDKRKTALDQLKEGLKHMGFLEAARQNDFLMLPLFVFSQEYSVTSAYIRRYLVPAITELKPANTKQTSAQKYALECISKMTDEESKWLYEFITGLMDPPIKEEPMRAEFIQDERQKLPTAHTCAMLLRIPVANKDIKEFRKAFITTVENHRRGFGCY